MGHSAVLEPPQNGKHTVQIASGLLFWACFCIVAVAVRGVRWDENYEFAQVLLGQVAYPDGHPLAQYVHGFYSLQTWSLAALMKLLPGTLAANGLRNALFLLATVWPPFLLGTLLSGRARWGHAAALLVLMGIHVSFYSNYPVLVWPGLYSNGHIGLGWALMTLTLLLFGYARSGGLMLGLMPAIHMGQCPPLWCWAVIRGIWFWRRGQRDELRRTAPWLLAGIAASVLFGILQHRFALPPPATGPYASSLAPQTVLHGYMTHFPEHRAIPWDTGQIVVVMAVLLTAPAARWLRMGRDGSLWLGGYAWIVAAIVWSCMAIQSFMGAATPWVVTGWMPYRLINHLSPPLIAIFAALLGEKAAGRPWLAAALLFGVLRPLLGVLLPETLFARYFAMGDAVFFALAGAAAVLLAKAGRQERTYRLFWMALAGLGIVALGLVHQFGAACCLLGAAAAAASQRSHLFTHPRWNTLAAFCGAALLCLLLFDQGQRREHLPVTPLELQVRRYLDEHGESDALLLVPFQQESLQARLGHPVMTDMATLTWIPYRPSLGPSLCKMYKDLYGIAIVSSGEEPPGPRWFDVWRARTRAEWQGLAAEYGFQFVLVPAFLTLDLPKVVEDATGSLYAIKK